MIFRRLNVWGCFIPAGRRLGRAGLSTVSERKPYKTDLPDEQWALIEPVIAAWKAAHPSVSGHLGRYAMREMVLDTQSVHAAAGVPAQSTGRDAAKTYRAASAAWALTCWAW